MGNFRDNRGGGRRDFGKRDFGKRNSDRSEMHSATCSSCGNECQVPFKPTGSRPIFCSKCFETNGGSSDSRRPEGRTFGRGNTEDKPMYNAICDNCGNSCSVPFQPRSGKPVYCNNCFGSKYGTGTKSTDNYKDQFAEINAKLDKILSVLVQEES